MGYRKDVCLSLIKELLGPRDGAHESIENDPREEYSVGILEPKDYNRGEIENYSRSDFKEQTPSDKGTIEGGVFEDEDADITDLDQKTGIFTSIDPRALPKSMGVSFVIESSGTPLINLCVTWARYIKDNSKWKRQPKNFILLNHDVTSELRKEPEKGTLITTRAISIGEKKWHVSIYVVNTSKDFKKILETDHLIFQPQIRVNLTTNVKLTSLFERSIKSDNEKRLAMLYRDLPALARGHMCSAVWAEVDPERNFDGKIPEELIPPDIKILYENYPNENYSNMFTKPSVRSEYLPFYSVVQSTIEVNEITGMNKEDLHAGVLSEKWNPSEVLKSLKKLTAAYEGWILNQRKIAETLHSYYRDIALKNVSLCELSLSRIKDGINVLETDKDAMVSFYFMNKAMNIQSEWIRKAPLIWRPFQMAFILQCLHGIVDETHNDRNLCDLLWFPTGGGKTEAYLGLMIFTIVYLRKKQNLWDQLGLSSDGTVVLSRYTLRLLTIQQFRRTLNAITACELLRIMNWKPSGYSNESLLWGNRRFSIGLWIGSNVTPNNMLDGSAWDNEKKMQIRFVGAVGKLMYTHEKKSSRENVEAEGEPAQVLNCPSCDSILAIPKIEGETPSAFSEKDYVIYWTVSSDHKIIPDKSKMSNEKFKVTDVKIHNLPRKNFYVVETHFIPVKTRLTDNSINDWCRFTVLKTLDAKLECAAGSRPGYFIIRINDTHKTPVDFEIRCPNPLCELNKHEWFESNLQKEGFLTPVAEPFELSSKSNHSIGIPIPAFTVDSQIYSKCPSIVLATVDKFARLPFVSRCASIFGNVDMYDKHFGYYRNNILPDTGNEERLNRMIQGEPVKSFLPPQLIIQDELHLIEGPLGSMVGLYEIGIDVMSMRFAGNKIIKPKYIASTATIRQADDQVKSLYSRVLSQFPSQGVNILDNFFSKTVEEHPLNDRNPGRLYIGICAPGKGPQTPIVRIWTNLLQTVEILRRNNGGKVDRYLDQFWTIVGYFNAIRELAGVMSLYRQDIPERLKKYGNNARPINENFPIELSSRKDSLELPAIMKQLEKFPDNYVDAVLATSMFGTGVDVDRLGLMVVHGQPKTTASYIQSTGRVGRKMGGLVVTFLRSTRPRDLDHYEFFIGYHRTLHKQVEPVTVAPFSARASERALGPVIVGILRNSLSINNIPIHPQWGIEIRKKGRQGNSGSRMMHLKRNSNEIEEIIKFILKRSQEQPDSRKKDKNVIENNLNSDLDRWANISRIESDLLYYEPAMLYQPENPVVLGDAPHKKFHKKQVFENVPQSLREVEQTARFEG